MEGNGGRKLGWIAIALGGLALFVALSGRMQMHGERFSGPQGYYNGPQNFQAAPAAPVAPQGQFDPRDQMGPRGQFDPRDQMGPRGQFDPRDQMGPHGGFQGRMGWGGPRHGFPFFFLPFMLLGGLMRIAFVILLVWLGLRLIRGGGRGPWGRGGGRGPWNQGQGPRGDQDPPSKPGPEQPPYTGDTQQM